MSAPDHETVMADAAGYALGTLEPEERVRFEAHLAGCPTCQAELAQLGPAAALVTASGRSLPATPDGLRERTLHAVERAAGPVEPAPTSGNGAFTAEPSPAVSPRLGRRRGRRPARSHGLRFALAAAAVAAVLAVLFVGRGLEPSDLPGSDPGPLEAVATLQAPGGDARARLDVYFTQIGRVIDFDSGDLPILPEREYYELWFVGPGDRPGAPNRISAGTFHPDEDGRSKATFTGAVDPERYPGVAVTAEPGDGDPSPSGPDVLRGGSRLRGEG